jgi:hypothetical protein
VRQREGDWRIFLFLLCGSARLFVVIISAHSDDALSDHVVFLFGTDGLRVAILKNDFACARGSVKCLDSAHSFAFVAPQKGLTVIFIC